MIEVARETKHPAAELLQKGMDPTSEEFANHPARLKGRQSSYNPNLDSKFIMKEAAR